MVHKDILKDVQCARMDISNSNINYSVIPSEYK
uniref:Uncharacterized protein n=1 Tax=Anguilla anguilla TaxID=7936 RepID=A0A0E9VN52_ANGAN